MIFIKHDGHFILLSQDDNMIDTIKESVPNAMIVDISTDEYNQFRDKLSDLEQIIESKIK